MFSSSVLRSPAFRRSTTLLTVAISANAWVANNAFAISARRAIAPATRTTLAEAAPSFSSSAEFGANEGARHGACGRAFYPRDVYYDAEAKSKLEELRALRRDEIADGGGAASGGGNKTNTNSTTLGVLKESGGKYSGTLTLIGYKGGPLESQINQDRAVVLSPFVVGNKKDTDGAGGSDNDSDSVDNNSNKLIGCFDGHARLGEVVSDYVVKELPKLLASKLDKIQPKSNYTDQVSQAITETFVEMDRTAPAEISGGCTATIVLQKGSRLYVANAGDSRSFVVVYRAKAKTAEVVYISREDKPSLPDERERVEKAGGKVLLPPTGTSRVLYTDPESGLTSGLAMSRSIGDWEVGKFGVIPDPIIDTIDIDEVVEQHSGGSEDDVCIFAVSATDGCMDYTNPEGVAAVLARSMYEDESPHLLTAMEQIIYTAAAGWERAKRGTYRDDIAISVCAIRIPPSLLQGR
ncbi:unnamed protein product [Pseudo-nitzschia multistriata]|uniref:PPM-type phosphatase domain-containing protein n=1 Tax=Pseudo-nitzschia multistriata TaxID=183589 RepID=A0A448YXQ9_9STRA|nr:unnamed protein product [Pseudo-nitzschia multistriata]